MENNLIVCSYLNFYKTWKYSAYNILCYYYSFYLHSNTYEKCNYLYLGLLYHIALII